jgi:hypothetical protein
MRHGTVHVRVRACACVRVRVRVRGGWQTQEMHTIDPWLLLYPSLIVISAVDPWLLLYPQPCGVAVCLNEM